MLERSDIEALAVLVARELAPLIVKKRWLSLREAAAEFSIGENRLIYLAKVTKEIRGYQDNTKRKDWLFDRESLEKYRDEMAPVNLTHRQKAIAILSGERI